MAAYMDLDDVPATGNKWLLQDILRNEWGFKGFVVSDWESVKNLSTHGFAKDTTDAAYRGFTAGVNMEMTSDTYRQALPTLVANGKVSKAQLDAMVRPILEMKYRLGLFTNPYVDMAKFKRETLSAEQRAASKVAAEGSVVLMRNEGHLLPLAKGLKTIAVVGPLEDSQVDTIGSWSLHATPTDTVTIVQGLREKLPDTKLLVAKGVEIKRSTRSIFDEQAPEPKPTLVTDEQKKAAWDEALADVQQADLTIMVLGEAQNMNGENASRATLTLPGRQEELLESAVATGKPIVLVLMTGRPLDITWAAGHVPAILNVWYPGTEGGHAVADLLMGDATPSGKLPLSWPRSVGQEPLFYNANLTQDPGARGNRYWDEPSTPLYPFGFGLSYTTFAIDQLFVGAPTLARDGSVDVRVRVKNTGPVAGQDVVQMYTHQRSGSASRPGRELKGFTKILLKPGEERVVTLRLSADELHFWSPTLRKDVLEPGTFDVWVGDDSNASLHATVNVQ
jgi:beta-glucosidase